MKNQSGIAPLLIVILIALVLAVGGGAYFMMHRSVSPRAAEETPARTTPAMGGGTAVPEAIPTGEFTMDITTLLGRRQNLECDVKSPTGKILFTGKLWTTGDKGRSTINTTLSQGLAMEANAIYKDGNMSLWSYMGDKLLMAKTMSQADATAATGNMTAQQKAQAEQYKSQMIFNCRPWTPDMSKFELPAGVTFTPMEIPR